MFHVKQYMKHFHEKTENKYVLVWIKDIICVIMFEKGREKYYNKQVISLLNHLLIIIFGERSEREKAKASRAALRGREKMASEASARRQRLLVLP